MQPQLLNIDQALNTYKHLHIAKPKFGMDVTSEDFRAKDIVILQNDGSKQSGSPVRFDFYTMILCLHGGSKRSVNQYTFTIKEHSLQLLPFGVIHSFEDTHERSEFYVVLFDKSFLDTDAVVEYHNENLEPVELNTNHFQKVKALYEEIDEELKNKCNNYINYIQMLLRQIILILQREKLRQTIPIEQTRADLICSQFLELVEERFLISKTVSKYAELLELSSKHLSETIKDKLGKSALYFIHQRLIKEAEYLLVYTDMSVFAIASHLNFHDASQFSRFFKKHLGISPKNYRINFKLMN